MQMHYIGMIFYFVIIYPKGIFDIYISLVQVGINFLLTSGVSFKISPMRTLAGEVICITNVRDRDI